MQVFPKPQIPKRTLGKKHLSRQRWLKQLPSGPQIPLHFENREKACVQTDPSSSANTSPLGFWRGVGATTSDTEYSPSLPTFWRWTTSPFIPRTREIPSRFGGTTAASPVLAIYARPLTREASLCCFPPRR